MLVYPYLSVQSPLQQLRCLRPIAPDKTLSEIWHFRLKGAPEAIYRRSLWYYNLVNSPATMINADDLENWTKGQWGLQSNGGDWVSFHRNLGGDREENGVIYSNNGTSEAVMRNQFRAWRDYMQGADGARRLKTRASTRHGATDRLRAAARQDVVIEASRRVADRRQRDRARPLAAARTRRRRCTRRRRAAAARAMVDACDVQREVEQFLFRQAELLDAKHWQAWIDLFADDGVYWMPVDARADRMGWRRRRSSPRTS